MRSWKPQFGRVTRLARRDFTSQGLALNYKAPMTDVQFLCNEVYKLKDHYPTVPNIGGEAATPDTVEMILSEMAKFCENDLSPINETADSVGCKYINEHEVHVPPGFKEAYDTYVASGWQGLNYPEEWGGQGLPGSLAVIASEMCATANWTWTMYPGLSKGCINTVLAHGSDELKQVYLEKLVEGTWTGTMCLTEPHCGSDLAQVRTKAVPIEGTNRYKLSGTKIFISCGEHNMTDNIIHCVLARLPGAPEGTKGISLFLVPKKKVDHATGEVGALNGAKIGRIEDKMGCHGSSTCEINFEDAEGYLIGTPNKGLNHMFTFINTSRVGTAIQGVAAAELSYQNALWYGKERLAMRSLTGKKNPAGPADPIIVHPDVRKMLLTQKAFAEGGRSMIYECALLADKMQDAEASGREFEAKAIDDRMGFLTPILKGYLTEVGVEAANIGIQVYGGHGYIKSNKQEQVFRDVRISAVWEGTTGIQALDLLGRKIMLQKLQPLNQRCSEVRGVAWDLMTSGPNTQVKKHAAILYSYALEWQYLTYRIAMSASRNKDSIGVASVDYLMYSGYVTMALHWLKMEAAAARALEGKPANADFYTAKLQTSRFYFENILPRTRSLVKTMKAPVDSIMSIPTKNFSADYALE